MKKLFVSIPMNGRSDEDIKLSTDKMKKIAEAFEGEELELIGSYVEEDAPDNVHPGIWYLGESLKKLAEADIFIGITDASKHSVWKGCYIEAVTAKKYGIKTYSVDADIVINDYDKLLSKLFNQTEPVSIMPDRAFRGEVKTVLL